MTRRRCGAPTELSTFEIALRVGPGPERVRPVDAGSTANPTHPVVAEWGLRTSPVKFYALVFATEPRKQIARGVAGMF